MENNNNNLFTNMFGLESEEPKEQIQPVPTPKAFVENKVIEQQITQAPQPIQNTPQVEEIITLDSNKPIAEEPPIQVEQPSLNTINMNTNYQPQIPPYQQDEDFSFDTDNPNNYKKLCVILGITLVVVLIAFPLYIGLNNYFSKTTNNSNNQIQQEENLPTQEQPVQKEEQTTPPVIDFDLDLSFDKGYTNNQQEYHQTVAYKPEQYEGVIKCESIKTAVSSEGQFNNIIYLYYKDLMVKKYITVSDVKLNNAKSYAEYIAIYQELVNLTSSNEHLFTKLLVSNSSYRINFFMFVDLAYNQAIRVPDQKIYYDVVLSYNIPVKNAMNKFLTNPVHAGNLHCSTLATVDASL